MIYDLFFGGKQKISGGGKWKKLVMENYSSLEKAMDNIKSQNQIQDLKELLPEKIKNPSFFFNLNNTQTF